MAEKENKPTGMNGEVEDLDSASVGSPENLSTADRLKAAAENLDRASADSKQRQAELERRRAAAEKDAKSRMDAAAKQREQNEKRAKDASDAQIAEFDYAQNYRKKLLKDKEAADAAERQRELEQREATAKADREARAAEREASLEAERREARERSERADSLLNSVIKRADGEGDASDSPKEDAAVAAETPVDDTEPADEIATAIPADDVKAASEDSDGDFDEAVTKDEAAASDDVGASESEASETAEDIPSEKETVTYVEKTVVFREADAADEATEPAKEADAADEAEEPAKEADAADEAAEPAKDAEEPIKSDGEAAPTEDAAPKTEDGITGEESATEDSSNPSDVIELEFEAIEVRDGDATDDDEPFEMAYDEDGRLVIRHGSEIAEDVEPTPDSSGEPPVGEEPEAARPLDGGGDGAPSDEDRAHFEEHYRRMYEARRALFNKNRGRREDVSRLTAEDFVIYDDIVAAIKAEGERLDNFEHHLKAYYKNSRKAIKNFEAAAKEASRTLKANRNESEVPAFVAEIIRIYAKILEIRCNNLENFARVKAQDYTRKTRIALHGDIDTYNEYVIMYSSLTGEQLTRMSTFLPEKIAEGKALAVVPKLTYKEKYVQEYPDETETDEHDKSTNTVIAPMLTAEMLFEKYKPPRGKLGCASYRRKAIRATRKLQKGYDYLGKLINETSLAERKYENELKRLEIATPLPERASTAYKDKVFRIRMKYGKQLTSIGTVKTKSAFAKTKLRLLVSQFAIEREKLIVAYNLLHETYRVGKYSQKKYAEEFFVGAMRSYNKCAEFCTRIIGTEFKQIPSALIEQVCRGEATITFPVVAYRRQLVETVGDSSRVVKTALKTDMSPEDEAYLESAGMMFGKTGTVKDTEALSEESAMVDRASSIAKVLLESLNKSASEVVTLHEFDNYVKKSKKIIRYFKRCLKRTERAIARAFDENGVVTALVENLRVTTNLIEVRRINIALAMRMDRTDQAKSESRALYKNIERYNGRAIDYMSIVGEQFSRITTMTSSVLMQSADSIRVPTITYKDNYIEVFPKNPLDAEEFEKPVQRRGGVYTPLLMQHFRLTENRAVETTVINTPFVFDVTVDDMPTISWWHPTGFFQYLTVIFQPIVAFIRRICVNAEIWFVDESLLFVKDGIKGRQDKNVKKRQKYEMKLRALSDEHTAKLLALETVIHDSDRQSPSYQKKLYKINTKFSRDVYKLKMRWLRECPGRTGARLLLERLVLERERIIGMNKVLIKYRNYGRVTLTRNVLVRYKKKFLDAIVSHNETAKKLSELIGTKFSEVATSVADEIIRYGNVVKFPQVVCCREVIETIEGTPRTVGDRWHGFGLYTGTTGSSAGANNAPIMSVGAMGYSTDMGVPYLKADFDGMTMLGMTAGGVPLIGFAGGGGEVGTAAMRAGTDARVVRDRMPLGGLPFVEYPNVDGPLIPFTGIPMMLAGSDDSPVLETGLYGQNVPILGAVNATDPYSGVNTATIDADYVEAIEDQARVGITIETPVDLPTKMIEEHFVRSLRARSMTMIDGVKTWWKLVGSEINVRFLRALTLRPQGFLSFLLPKDDAFLENINMHVNPREAALLSRISRLGVIIDIECKRLYSAAKVGIRRSERKWSYWLQRDITAYNDLVNQYNALGIDARGNVLEGQPKLRNEWIEPLSLNIPDTIIHRLEDRPPEPPVFTYRNRVMVDENPTPFMTDDMLNPLYRYARDGLFRANPFRIIFVSIPRWIVMVLHGPKSTERKGRVGRILLAVLIGIIFCVPFLITRIVELIAKLVTRMRGNPPETVNFGRDLLMHVIKREIKRRSVKTYIRREDNEARHYRVRYEKARNMKLYNKRVLRAIGVANDPIKYQTRLHKVLRKYLARNFRIDYNMRIRQLVFRAMRVDRRIYWIGLSLFAIAMTAVMLISPDSAALWRVVIAAFVWSVLPIIVFLVKVLYDVILLITSIILLLTRNIWLIKYGANDVKENRYALVLDCFITEQYKLLVDCERFRQKPHSQKRKKQLIKVVNEYNKRCVRYSDVLRVPINEIEITALLEKLSSDRALPLSEIQNFLYARELIENAADHKAGEKLDDREFVGIINELNKTIDRLQNPNASQPIDDQQANFLAGKIRELGGWIAGGSSPSAYQRYVFKRDLYTVIESVKIGGSIGEVEANEFCKRAFKIVDYLGGKPKRKIVRVEATDDMVVRLPTPTE